MLSVISLGWKAFSQPGDVTETYADITDATADFGFKPIINIVDGLPKVIRWYREFYTA